MTKPSTESSSFFRRLIQRIDTFIIDKNFASVAVVLLGLVVFGRQIVDVINSAFGTSFEPFLTTELRTVVLGGLSVVIALVFILFYRRFSKLSVTLSTERERLSQVRNRSPREASSRPVHAGPGKVPPVPQELVEAVRLADVALVMGAGCSAQGSLPTALPFWLAVLDYVSDKIPQATQEILRDAIAEADTAAIESLLAQVGRDRLLEATASILDISNRSELPALHRILGERAWPAVVGLTWDELDLRAFPERNYVVVRPEDSQQLPELLRSGRQVLFKPIGDLRRPNSIAFTWQDYRKVLDRWSDLVLALSTLYSTRMLLFLGLSVDSIEQFLNGLSPNITSKRTHYALVPEDRANAVWQQGIGKRFNIQLIEMVPSASYPELPAFVRELIRLAPPTKPRGLAGAPRAPELKMIHLENIGLFKSFELKPTDRWNVLLGVNGGGKSTVLKAISLALCGRDSRVESAAQRLLRADATLGSIILEFNHTTVTVELTRERNRVRINAPSVTPVEAGTMLALGFPALRGVSSARPVGYASLPKLDPSTEDIIPLVADPYDKRLDRFIQWALNIKLGADRDPTGPDAALLNTLEELISSIVPPRPVRFILKRIESGRYELMVDTGDAIVPFDLISQGMSSIFNWIGVLLQRLYDVFPPSKDPKNDPASKPALVLIDEIDAHLHPEWQRRLIDLIRDHFTSIQVIATCHSPLIVGALDRSEVVVIRNGKPFQLTEDPKGMNVEDILTSAGFGMFSTRAEAGRREIARYLELFSKPLRNSGEEKEYEALSRRFGKLRYGTSAREERVRKIAYEALRTVERVEPAADLDPELRLLLERELGAVAPTVRSHPMSSPKEGPQ
jgi:hypothetical protein